MNCKEISAVEFDRISAELDGLERQSGPIETVSGYHLRHGWTVLLRDASRCMVLFDNSEDQDLTSADLSVVAEGIDFELASAAVRP